MRDCILISGTFLTLLHPGPNLLHPVMEVFPPSNVFVLDLEISDHLFEEWLVPGDEVLQQGDGVPVLVEAEHLVDCGPPEHAGGLQHVGVHPLEPRGLSSRPRIPSLRVEEAVRVQESALIVDHPEGAGVLAPHQVVHCL